ncbi:Phage major capsid protein [Candidatus Rhodobacter oscarellae]|uniref:Phage major capsid protein n=1 Tax=Candidatus Rhodobacter oscarellae TaxID=1675527 RepID=A0A0J9E2L1_9RHOB|nr:phage major capsid protein [Candidatus Rhodobacter lobularis]KMW56970.1 Phage major capsid protein [Candidatus Rhodobacter lobularis]
MPKTIAELRKQRDALAKEARNILDETTGEFDQKRIDEIYADIERIDAKIKAEQQQLDLEARLQSEASDPDTPTGNQNSGCQQPARPGDEVRAMVFDAYVRGGENAVNRLPENVLAEYGRQVQNAQSTGVDSEGGYLVPTTFSGVLLEAMAEYGGVRSVANVQSTASGENIQWPTVDETAVMGEWLAENAAAADGDVSFGTISIGAHLASSKVVAIPFALLQDAGIGNLEGMLNGLLAARLSRLTNRGYTIGDGNGKPTGIVNGAGLGHTTAVGLVDSFTYDDFVELEHSVDPIYRRDGSWMFHDTALKVAKKMKDGEGRPIWVPGISSEAPAEILNYGYTVNQDMAEPAAGADSMLFGDMSKYLVRDVMDITLFRFTDSAYTKKGQVGFLAMLRTDGKTIAANNAAIKKMRHAAA